MDTCRDKVFVFSIFAVLMATWLFLPMVGTAQLGGDEIFDPPGPLLLQDVPLPNLTGIVVDEQAAIALGKALFWDMQLGSDNIACASCHFHAGADNRTKNQLSPGLLLVVDDPQRVPSFGNEFGITASGSLAGANYNLRAGNFPLYRLQNVKDRMSVVIYETDDVVSSQGSFGGFLLVDDPNRFPDFCGRPEGEIFEVGGVPVRKVEPRNAPTTINAVFNHRNFWDGRANNVFNGVDPFGPRNVNARLIVLNGEEAGLEQMQLVNASLASQAVGPPLSSFEMACTGRTFADLSRGILPLRALGGHLGGNLGGSANGQFVHPGDSVLGSASGYRADDGYGLNLTYEQFIRLAFAEKYHAAQNGNYFEIVLQEGEPVLISSTEDKGYTQMEHNFSMFFGIALMLYQATLVSEQTPYDAFIAANPLLINDGEGSIAAQAGNVSFRPGFGQQELQGLDVFLNKGKCFDCHSGPEFTSATVRARQFEVGGEAIELMPVIDGGSLALYDGGFYNIGSRPTENDVGVGGSDPFGNPLSFARQLTEGGDPVDFEADDVPGFGDPIGARVAVDGALKTPTIRNVELTGPYMSSGELSTLRQVVEFYNRGGDRRDVNTAGCEDFADTSGFGDADDGSQCTNVHPDIVELNLTEDEIDALVAFMISLTDPRVKYRQAPFDHPELRVSIGHPGNQSSVLEVYVEPKDGGETDVRARDSFRTIPAVGAEGALIPLRTFLRLNHFTGAAPPDSIAPSYLPLLLDE